MSEPQSRHVFREPLPSWWVLHVFALFSLAVALPLYQTIGKPEHAPFLITHQSTGWDLLALILVCSFALPAATCLLVSLSGLISARLKSYAYLFILIGLLAVTLLPMINHLLPDQAKLAIALSLVLALLLTTLYYRKKWAKWFVSIMAIGVIAAPVSLYWSPSVTSLLSQKATESPNGSSSASEKPHVVMIVFDELPLISLLAEDRTIDSSRFPNFARLAKTSNWYRNTTAVHYSTMMAMTALMVGDDRESYAKNVFGADRPPAGPIDEVRIPQNLFTLLGDDYSIAATELVTRLAPERESAGTYTPPFAARFSELMRDTVILFGHQIVPKKLNSGLPAIEGQWQGFGAEDTRLPDAEGWPYVDSYKRLSVIQQFIDSLGKANRPMLYFLHTLLPHFPFEYDDTGRFHTSRLSFLSMHFREASGTVDWPDRTAAELAYQAHLLQLVFTDALLGRILDRLIAEDLFDESIVMVVADHGTSYFWEPGQMDHEQLAEIQAAGTAYVPWFLKMPGQTEAFVSDDPLQTIDILPTLADLTGENIPWRISGISAFGPVPVDRERFSYLPQKFTFETLDRGFDQALRFKLELFGTGSQIGTRINGPLAGLQSKPVSDFEIKSSTGMVQLEDKRPFEAPDRGGTSYSAYLKGRISAFEQASGENELFVAVAIDGIIRATARTTDFDISALRPIERTEQWDFERAGRDGSEVGEHRRARYFMTYIPKSVLDPEGSSVEIFGITGQPTANNFALLRFTAE